VNYRLYAILGALLLAHVIVATTATVVVLRDKSLERFQTISKMLVSWVIIYAGPLFVLYVMNEHSPELIPKFAQRGLFHLLLFGPVKPLPRGNKPMGNEGGYYENGDASDHGIGGEGSCGGGGD